MITNQLNLDKYEGHTEGPWYAEEEEQEDGKAWTMRGGDHWVVMESDGCLRIDWKKEDALLSADAPLLLEVVKRLRGLLDEIDDVVYYNDKKAGQVLPVEKPNLELLRDIMMSYTDEAYQIRGDEGGWIE